MLTSMVICVIFLLQCWQVWSFVLSFYYNVDKYGNLCSLLYKCWQVWSFVLSFYYNVDKYGHLCYLFTTMLTSMVICVLCFINVDKYGHLCYLFTTMLTSMVICVLVLIQCWQVWSINPFHGKQNTQVQLESRRIDHFALSSGNKFHL